MKTEERIDMSDALADFGEYALTLNEALREHGTNPKKVLKAIKNARNNSTRFTLGLPFLDAAAVRYAKHLKRQALKTTE